MTTSEFSPNQIGVPVGLGDEEQLALDSKSVAMATDLAKTFGSDIVLIHARPEPPVIPAFGDLETSYAEVAAAMKQWETKGLEKLRRQVEERSLHCDVRSCEAKGSVAKRVVEQAEKAGVDMLVLSSHSRHGAGWLLMGSVAEKIAHLSTIPVFLLPRAREEDA